MARMIPAVVGSDTKSRGEIEIFRRLRDEPATKDWIILHSLDISNHVRRLCGEADFVALIPGRGILCIEVKACLNLERDDNGLWFYGSDSKGDHRGPFKQAKEAMYSIRDYLNEKDSSLGGLFFSSVVVLPYTNAPSSSIEWQPWEVIDRTRYSANALGTLLEDSITASIDFAATKGRNNWLTLDSALCNKVASTLRPAFEFHEPLSSRLERREQELLYYTQEQFQALDAMEWNHRVLFSGPAGTGKTFLAIESARRAAAKGHKTLFLCYNRFLGDWLEKELESLTLSVRVKSIHRHLLEVAGTSPPADVDDTWWSETLPFFAAEKVMDDPAETFVYDEIIVDEIQDLLKRSYLDFIGFSLRGGIASGYLRLFGDLEKQNIFARQGLDDEEISGQLETIPRYSLLINCRNTPRIAGFADKFGELDPPYRGIRRPDNDFDPEFVYFEKDENQSALLTGLLDQLFRDKYTGSEIVILSPRATNKSATGKINVSPWKDRIRPFGDAGLGGYIRYTTIHAFKGLEAPVVIVTDISNVSDELSRDLLYIASTRALERLYIIADAKTKADVLAMIVKTYQLA